MTSQGVQTDGYQGQADPTTFSDPFNAISFLVNQVMNGNWTVTLGQVKSVSGGGTAGPATVSVQPMVNMVDGYGNATPHGTINNLPAFRLQGGTNGFVVDPVVGDIGIVAFASRDISSVIKNKKPSNPGSKRTFDPADGIFIGGLLGAALTQYISFTDQGIQWTDAAGNVLVSTSSGFVMTPAGGVFKVNGAIHATGGVIAGFGGADQVGLQTHTHTQGVDSHGDTEDPTSAPTAGT